MKTIKYTDERGRISLRIIRSDMDETQAQYGLPVEPPNIDELDWEGIKREIHNLLVERGLFNLEDINRNAGTILSNTVAVAIVPRLIELYKERERQAKEAVELPQQNGVYPIRISKVN